MFRTVILAALALVCAASSAEARRAPGAERSCIPTSDVMRPCAYNPNFLAGVKSIKVSFKRERTASLNWRDGTRSKPVRAQRQPRVETASYGAPTPSVEYSVARPAQYIAGKLICAVNVGVALAERGIKGTGSALALSYLKWGRSAGGPVPGAVIVSGRRGGGHVAIVSRVENGVVYAWNATGGQNGWREIPYRHHVIDYRVPS